MNDATPILHTIRPGDTLYTLAMQYGTTVQDILDTNLGVEPYNLRVGQQIYIYPKEEVRRMLYEHLRLTTEEVKARLRGDYAADINAFDMVQKEILKMSHFL